MMRNAVEEMLRAERLGYSVVSAAAFVDSLLQRGTESDVAEAQGVIERLADLKAEHDSAMLEITMLRVRALLAGARGERDAYRDFVARYRAMAQSLGYEGHLAWAARMPG